MLSSQCNRTINTLKEVSKKEYVVSTLHGLEFLLLENHASDCSEKDDGCKHITCASFTSY